MSCGGSSKDEVIGFALSPEISAKPDGFNKEQLVGLLCAQTGSVLCAVPGEAERDGTACQGQPAGTSRALP